MKAVLTILSLVFFMSANAQSNQGSHTVSMVLANVIELALTGGNPSMSFTTAAHYQNGVTSSTTPTTLTVSSNKAYSITALASSADNGNLVGSSVNIPIAKLTVTADNGSNYLPLSGTVATTIKAAQAAGGGVAHSVYYKANPGFGYAAGTYTTTITYTATQD
ncbi:MAG: hypothetical protein JWP69_822 [Flaviaesturariibacter sp.]|nr:hypothetical protein [Flaviaesturariibacter sp.]